MLKLPGRIAEHEGAPYIYNYPPTRMYQPLGSFSAERIKLTPVINLYVHIPFCEQKCTFCGYLTVIDTSGEVRKRYVDAVCHEVRLYASYLQNHEIASINFGGGTPSLLTSEEVEQILATIKELNPRVFETAIEMSIEATPETVEWEKFSAYRKIGINRVSIGIQTFDDSEIRQVKRHNLPNISVQALTLLKAIGFENICVDLMYGLPLQTGESFCRSVESVLAHRPTTVELYNTVAIPGTAFAKRDAAMPNEEKILCYEYARKQFLSSGYRQDCHLRFALQGGGYNQQANVYALQSLLGFGVGARSYTEKLHYRTVYDTKNSRVALRTYMERVSRGEIPVEEGFSLSASELERRYLVHQLERFDGNDFYHRFGRQVNEVFSNELTFLLAEGIMHQKDLSFFLAPEFFCYRDVIAQEFFSPEVRRKEKDYYPEILHAIRLPK